MKIIIIIRFILGTFTKKEMVMKMEKMNMPPKPYKCKVLLPERSISGMEIRVMITITNPIPMVAYFALVSDSPVVLNRFVE